MIKIAIELASGALALGGQFFGSTGQAGSVLCCGAGALWILWMCRYKQWGFIPINIAGTGVCLWNVWHAFL